MNICREEIDLDKSHINMFVGDGSRNIKSIFFKFMFAAFYAKKFKVTMFIKVERDKLLL